MKVTIYDNSSYEPGRCSNGGNYGFWQVLSPVTPFSLNGTERRFRIEYCTTHEFGICPNCGDLCQNADDAQWHENCDPFLSGREAAKLILDAKERQWSGEKARYIDDLATVVVYR